MVFTNSRPIESKTRENKQQNSARWALWKPDLSVTFESAWCGLDNYGCIPSLMSLQSPPRLNWRESLDSDFTWMGRGRGHIQALWLLDRSKPGD